MFSQALAEEDPRKRRRNKKERGGSLFSLRKKKDKKETGKGLTKAGSAASLSRPISAPRVPQHSYSMSSIKRYPPSSSQFYLARSESRYELALILSVNSIFVLGYSTNIELNFAFFFWKINLKTCVSKKDSICLNFLCVILRRQY